MNNNNQNPWGNDNQDSWGNQSEQQINPWDNQPKEQGNLWSNNTQNPWEEQKNPWLSSQGNINNPYLENIYQENHFDNPYTETFSNPDPQNEQDSGWEL